MIRVEYSAELVHLPAVQRPSVHQHLQAAQQLVGGHLVKFKLIIGDIDLLNLKHPKDTLY